MIDTIEQNPELECLSTEMQKRARLLLKQPELGEEVIGKTSLGEDIRSNCWGTTIHLLGERYIERARELSKKENDPACPVFFWIDGRPGLIGEPIMTRFLENYCIRRDACPIPSPELIYSMETIGRHQFLHAGITLNNWRTIEQPGLGKKFQVGMISAKESRNYRFRYYSLK